MTKEDVLNYFGGTVKTANAIEVRHTTVSMWGEFPPHLRQCEIELLTAGALKREPKNQPPCHHHPETKVS